MTEQGLLDYLKQNPFVLSPMAGITDTAFRSFMREMGCGIVVTELVSATGLKYSSEKTRTLMKFTPDQHPIGIQLFGEDLENLAMAAKESQDLGADFVDLNFGCPVPKVVNKGGGAAILKDLPQMAKVLKKVKGAVSIPVTIKIRTGWDQQSRNALDVTHIAYNEGITWVAMHGRTRAQGYNGLADWSFISEVRKQSQIPILGNGDIASGEQALSRISESGCPGVLVGRGCLKNPFLFREAMELKQNGTVAKSRDLKLALHSLLNHLSLHFEEKVVSLQMKKFAAWFSTGQTGAAVFRKNLFQTQGAANTLQFILNYFESLPSWIETNLEEEPLLKAGHG